MKSYPGRRPARLVDTSGPPKVGTLAPGIRLHLIVSERNKKPLCFSFSLWPCGLELTRSGLIKNALQNSPTPGASVLRQQVVSTNPAGLRPE